MPAKIKIVYMGTPEFAVPPLLALIGDPDFKVVAVVTQEDKKIGRKQILTAPPVKTAALKFDIPVLQPPSFKNNHEIVELLKGLNADFFVVAAYGQILPQAVLDIPLRGCINIHGSLLPKYRGASPVEESLLKGDSETGISFIKMTAKMDAGPVFIIHRLEIGKNDTSPVLREKLSGLAALQITFLLKDIVSGSIEPIEQDEKKATYCKKIVKENGIIDLDKFTSSEILNMIKAYDPWPGCFLVSPEKRLKILRADADNESKEALNTKSHQSVDLSGGKIGIGTKKGLLIPLEVQLEGKNPMKIQDFLLGNKTLLARLLESAR